MTRRSRFEVGDAFLVPLQDGYGAGQVLEITPDALNSVICAFFDVRYGSKKAFEPNDISERRLISVQFVTPDLLKNGIWTIVGRYGSIDLNRYVDLDVLKGKRFLGVEIQGSKIIVKFLNAYFALIPWDVYKDPEYFDHMLLDSHRKPKDVYYKR